MYAILRTQKHKTIGAVARSGRHTFRQQATPNADPNAANPAIGCKSTEGILSVLKQKLPSDRRRDAVLCIEYLITASPEAFNRNGGHLDEFGNGYFRDALNWLNKRHGQSNVISAVVHLDETTPHLVAYVVPLTRDGRLSARDFLGGPKVMRTMQDSFHSACAASRGLSRGVRGSKAKHQDISHFYEALKAAGSNSSLRTSDYALKVAGFETAVWREAQDASNANEQYRLVQSLHKKGIASRSKVLGLREQELDLAAIKLKQSVEILNKRELELAKREAEVVRRQPELLVEKARSEGLERIIQHYENEGLSLSPSNRLKKLYRSELSL